MIICGSQHKSLSHHLLSRALLAEHVLTLMVAQIVTRSLHVQKHLDEEHEFFYQIYQDE